MVFLPAHKSHMDYIIVTYLLANLGIPVPRIAAGDNLQLPLVSYVEQSCYHHLYNVVIFNCNVIIIILGLVQHDNNQMSILYKR